MTMWICLTCLARGESNHDYEEKSRKDLEDGRETEGRAKRSTRAAMAVATSERGSSRNGSRLWRKRL